MDSLPILLIVRGAVVLALALLVVHLARRSAAALRHSILASALVATLALPAIQRLVPVWHTGAISLAGPPTAVEPVAIPIAETATFVGDASPVVVRSPQASPIPWRGLVIGVWLFGVAAFVLRFAIGAWRARSITWRGEPVFGIGVVEAWRALGGRGDPPRVVRSAEVESPIVVGAFDPIVVVPVASSEWTVERWRVVLLHELAHVRRYDGVINAVAHVACCVQWANPLVWLVERRMRDERELAADDAVLSGGARPSTYAEHLIAIANAKPPAVTATAIAMAESSRFETRVIALLDPGRARGPAGTRRALVVGAVAAIVAMIVAGLSLDGVPVRSAVAGPAGRAARTATDAELQVAVEAELAAAVSAHRAAGAIAIVLDAKSGDVVASATRGTGDIRAARPPGSTMKPFTFAAALEAGVVTATTRIDCEGGTRVYGETVLHDASPNGTLDLGGILAVSSNVCTAKIAEMIGDRFAEALHRYHVAAPARIDTHSLEGAAIASGLGIQVAALDVASAYTAIADGGVYHARDGSSDRVMSEPVARTVLSLLERPIVDAGGTARAARIEGVRVAGKTGTVKSSIGRGYYASFVGIVPADAPRFVVLVGVDGVDGQGGTVAAPVFAKIAARALAR
ncbi:MAG: penicillin-binding transpeptidase domain-containing protein [Kofleriaceae bacterium]